MFAEKGVDRLSSVDLAASLNELEESPWGDIRGKALDARALARSLSVFEIRPRTRQTPRRNYAKSYLLDLFEYAFSRYIGAPDRHTDTTRTDTGFAADTEPSHVTYEESRKPASANGCDRVAD